MFVQQQQQRVHVLDDHHQSDGMPNIPATPAVGGDSTLPVISDNHGHAMPARQSLLPQQMDRDVGGRENGMRALPQTAETARSSAQHEESSLADNSSYSTLEAEKAKARAAADWQAHTQPVALDLRLPAAVLSHPSLKSTAAMRRAYGFNLNLSNNIPLAHPWPDYRDEVRACVLCMNSPTCALSDWLRADSLINYCMSSQCVFVSRSTHADQHASRILQCGVSEWFDMSENTQCHCS